MEAALTTRGEANSPRAGSDTGDALASLVARAALGEERAWEELVRLYAGRVYALAQSRLRRPDLAEEITQSVFVTIATKLKDQQYAEQGRFEPWLFRVTMNRVRDTARRMKRQAGVLEPGVIEAMASGSAVQAGADTDETASLRQALETLNDADREVIELRHHGRMGFKEIAELLGEPVGTVLARHHRALRKLRSVLEPDRTSEDLS
jgi:RNA polymerase sigma-70 factor (ECF subfamily)